MSNIRLNTLEINEIETDSLIIGNWTITLNTDSSALIFSKSTVNKFQIDGIVKYGCTDNTYLEYDATADLDNGTCSTIKVSGCTNSSATNYNSSANSDDGTCTLDKTFSYNYDNLDSTSIANISGLKASLTTAITNDITTTLTGTGVSYTSFTNDGFKQTIVGGSIVNGITQTFTVRRLESNATSLDAKINSAITDNTFTKTQVQSTVTSNSSIVETGESSTVSVSNIVIKGCATSTALNYNADATNANNTCIGGPSITLNVATQGTIQVTFTRESGVDISTNGTHQLKYFFDLDSTSLSTAYASVFTANVTSADSTITVKILNSDNSLFLYMGQIDFTKSGCTITEAVNYNQYANSANNTTCTGCTDATAANYNATIAGSGSTGYNCVYAPSRKVVENEITMVTNSQSAITFGASATDKQIQYYFDNDATKYFIEYDNTIVVSNLTAKTRSVTVNVINNDQTLYVNTVNNKRIMTLTGRNRGITYTENDAATIIDDSITISDETTNQVDSVLIKITDNFFTYDSLAFTASSGITGVYTNADKTLRLSGRTTNANYTTALRTVTYVSPNDNINDDNSKNSREFTFTIYNSNAGKTVTNQRSIVQSFTIVATIDNPVLTMGKNVNTEFTEHGAGSFVDDSIIINDADDVNLDSAVIRISANYDYIVNSPSTGNALNLGDSLFFAYIPTPLTVSYTYGQTTGDSITISGSAPVDSYVLALRNLKFKNNSDDPTNNDTKRTRTVTIKVRDVSLDGLAKSWSSILSRTINVTAVLDLPKLADSRTR